MVSRDIKIATKKKFNPSRYKSLKKTTENVIDLKYLKERTNVDILNKRLDVLFEKGRFKDSKKAKEIIKRYQGIVKLTTNIFLSKTKSLSSAKFISYQKGIDPRQELVSKVIKEFTLELKKLSGEGLKVEFIEEMNPLIDKYLKNFMKKINFKEEKQS